MIMYTHNGGYGNIDLAAVEEAIRAMPADAPGRQLLLDLKYDYECLLRVIDGKGCVFRHEDGSETMRLKMWR